MKIDVSTRDGYDLACALRGPDVKPRDETEKRFVHLLKLHTAGRLRYLVGCMVGVTSAGPMDPLDRETLMRCGEEIGDRLADYPHYIHHAKEGALALSRLKADSKAEMHGLTSFLQDILCHISRIKEAIE